MGLRFDQVRFLEAYTTRFGVLRASARDGLVALLVYFSLDPFVADVRWIAYMLATEYHEGAHGFVPIEEFGRGRGKRYGRLRSVRTLVSRVVRQVAYYGRGRVQLTWLENYRKADGELRRQYPEAVARFEARTGAALDLVGYPEQALDPELSYLIMSAGMRQGWFTGHTLARWLSPTVTNYLEARRIINGRDRAAAIADHARRFEACLREASLEELPASPPEPSPVAFLAGQSARPVATSATGLVSSAVAALGAGLPWVAAAIAAIALVGLTAFVIWAVLRYRAIRREQRASA